ncbi:alpha/beta hydrolase [Paenibacillus planticolens]|nr:alpha/beta hydrolase-fold protein [Paenibacillus planticolens]
MRNTEQYLLHSEVCKRTYQIYAAAPAQEPPPQGFPVIYLLDANAMFATMVEAMRVQARRPEKTGVHPAVIVGIGYPTDEPFDPSRSYDFTMPTPKEVLEALPVRNENHVWPEVGGADAFRDFIEHELKPDIERHYAIDSSRQAIFGHSLGGLFVLQTLFTRPQAFQTYVAGSPSIHWNKALLREQEEQFRSYLEHADTKHNLLIAVGELEGAHPSNMVANAQELYERLAQMSRNKLDAGFHEFAGEGHVSVLPALVSRALRWIR